MVLARCDVRDDYAAEIQPNSCWAMQRRAMRTLARGVRPDDRLAGLLEAVEEPYALHLAAVAAIADPGARGGSRRRRGAASSAGIGVKIVTGDTPATAT